MNLTQGQIRILIVDDGPDNILLMENMLAKLGISISISTATSGRQALEILKQRSFDLVFLDCNMPDGDGYEVAREMKRRRSRVPLVACTSDYSHENRRRCAQAGMRRFFPKPYTLEALRKFLFTWLLDAAS